MPGRSQAAGDRRGAVLLAALVFVAVLATVVTAQLTRLPFAVAESRAAVGVVQRELDANSALNLAQGVLLADAARNTFDGFGDLWARPHTATVGNVQIKVRLSDWVGLRDLDDPWLRHEYGIPTGASLLASEDPYVHAFFRELKPNLNTAPAPQLAKRWGFGQRTLEWLKRNRDREVLSRPADLRGAPGLTEERLREIGPSLQFRSGLFFAEATIRRDDRLACVHYWVLQRTDRGVAVLYHGSKAGAG
ncbi:MAG: type II secretion system protein GspK [Candidatus Brocadiia bacterium]